MYSGHEIGHLESQRWSAMQQRSFGETGVVPTMAHQDSEVAPRGSARKTDPYTAANAIEGRTAPVRPLPSSTTTNQKANAAKMRPLHLPNFLGAIHTTKAEANPGPSGTLCTTRFRDRRRCPLTGPAVPSRSVKSLTTSTAPECARSRAPTLVLCRHGTCF